MRIQLSDHFTTGKLLRFVAPSIVMIAYGGGQRPRLRSSAAAVRPNGHPNIGS